MHCEIKKVQNYPFIPFNIYKQYCCLFHSLNFDLLTSWECGHHGHHHDHYGTALHISMDIAETFRGNGWQDRHVLTTTFSAEKHVPGKVQNQRRILFSREFQPEGATKTIVFSMIYIQEILSSFNFRCLFSDIKMVHNNNHFTHCRNLY